MSRDDYGSFINEYREKDIIGNDPFQTIDRDGVGELMKIAVGRRPHDAAATSSSASAASTAAIRPA